MANPQNKQGYIGQIVESNGKRLLLGANELRETLMNGIDYLSENKSCVQVYLRPRNGRDVSYICSVSNSRVQSILGVGADGSQVDVMTSQDAVLASAKSQILEFISSLIQLFQYDNKIIENGSFHFIIDDNGHVWLSEISPMSTLSQSSEVANTSSETVELEMTSSSPNASSVRASSGERLSLVRNSQFLSRNAKGEFISRLGKDSLSGLAAWEMSGVGEDWKVNLATYSINAADLDQYHDVDNASRYPLPYPFVAFIRMCEPLLLAKIPLNSTEEFVDAWKRSFQKFCRDYDYPNSSLFSGSQNDVIVDGNIYSIVKKLQSLIQSGFEAKLSTQDISLHDSRRSKSAGDVTMDANPTTRNAPLVDKNPRQAFAEEKESSLSAIKKDKEKDSSKKARINSIQTAYDDKTSKSKKDAEKKSLKKVKGFEPPSVELIAKFAAEKERQQMKLNAFEREMEVSRVSALLNKEANAVLDYSSSSAADFSEKDDAIPVASKSNVGMKKNPKTKSKASLESSNVEEQLWAREEKRLAGLEKAAQDSIRFHQQFAAFQQPLNTIGSNVSNTEVEFLQRQIHQGDSSSQLTLLPGELAMDSVTLPFPAPPSQEASAASSSAFKKIQLSLQERNENLEKQILSYQQIIQNKEDEIVRKDTKLKKLMGDLDALRKDKALEVQSLKEVHQMEILQMQEEHSRALSILASDNTSFKAVENQHSKSPSSKLAMSTSSSAHASKTQEQLLSQIESLRGENRKLMDQFAEERRSILVEQNMKSLGQERTFQAELSRLRAQLTDMEDKAAQYRDQCRSFQGDIDSLKAMNLQLENQKKEAVDLQMKYRADLKNMQQSMQTSYRLDATSSKPLVGGELEGEMTSHQRLQEAKNEAKLRQMANKVDFLKSQLAAEQQSNEELRRTVDNLNTKLEDIRQEFRLQLQECEAIKTQAVAETETRIENLYHERMQEFNGLQAKVLMMQGQLQEAFQETSLSKQREDASKSLLSKHQMQQSLLKTEVETLRQQLQEFKEQKYLEGKSDLQLSQMEANLRRVENERIYLKNQLASEMTHHGELKKALTDCQQELAEVTKQWKDDVFALKEKNANDIREAVNIEQKMKATLATLESQKDHLQKQHNEAKEAIQKMREQIRVEQLSNEETRAMNRRLVEQIELLKNDQIRFKYSEDQSKGIHNQELSSLKDIMLTLEREKNAEIQRLKEELAKQYSRNSGSQQELIEMRKQSNEEKKVIFRNNAVYRIVKLWDKMRLARLFVGFRNWQKISTLIAVASQFRNQLNQVVQDTIADGKSREVDALRQQEKKLTLLAEQERLQQQQHYNQEMEAFKVMMEEEKQAVSLQAQEECHQHLKVMEDKWIKQMDQLRADQDRQLERFQSQKEIRLKEMEVECQQHLEMQKKELEEHLKMALENLEKKKNEEWELRMRERESQMREINEKSLKALLESYDGKLKAEIQKNNEKLEITKRQYQAEWEAERISLMTNHEKALQELQRTLEEEKNDALYDLQAVNDQEKSKLQKELQRTWEQRMNEQKMQWQTDLAEKMIVKDQELEDLLAKKMKEYALSLEAERAKGIKLEASKWRQALKDADKRVEGEVQKAKEEAKREMQMEFEEKLRRETVNFEVRFQQMSQKYSDENSSLKRDHQEETNHLKNEHERVLFESIHRAESKLREDLTTSWEETCRRKVEEAWKDANQLWQERLDKEKERLELLKKDIASQTQYLAQERNDLRERLRASEEQVSKLESVFKMEQSQMLKDADNERTMLTSKHEKAKIAAIKTLEDEHKTQMEAMESRYGELLETRIAAEKAKISEEMDRQMNQMQSESEKLIVGLENALNDLRNEKTSLSDSLEKTTIKLEDTEDTLYDLQQEMKKQEKNNSLLWWKMMTNFQRMKQRFQKGLKDFDQEQEIKMNKFKEGFHSEITDHILSIMKLAVIVNELENRRSKMHDTLLTYKREELIEKRSRIRMIEQELERIQVEKDSLEEQRDSVEEDIDQLENQVQDIEDQIRSHNRKSSMENGRVNVAHARKKRRLDSELERLLEQIENKRASIGDLNDRVNDKSRQRDEKESDMIDLEKSLVQILLEQQRIVLGLVEESKSGEDKSKLLLEICQIPYPPISNSPNIHDAKQVFETIQKSKGDDR